MRIEEETIASIDNSLLNELSSVEICIEIMQNTSLIINPVHYHAFQKVPYTMFSRTCTVCQNSLSSSFWFGRGGAGDDVVRCIACGIYAHRSCCFSSLDSADSTTNHALEVCPVNVKLVQEARENKLKEIHRKQVTSAQVLDTPKSKNQNKDPTKQYHEENVSSEYKSESSDETMAIFKDSNKNSKENDEEQIQKESAFVWGEDGPPTHWALNKPESLKGITPSTSSTNSSTSSSSEISDMADISLDVSNLLHENLIRYFQRVMNLTTPDKEKLTLTTTITESDQEQNKELTMCENSTAKEKEDLTALLESNQTIINTEQINILKFAGDAFSASKRMSTIAPRLTMASIVGGIAGSAVGLAVAGPIGACIAPMVGRTCGIMSVLLFEGSFLVTGFTAGVQTVYNVQQFQNQFRFLSLHRENNTTEKGLVMLRPQVHFDELAWETILKDVKYQSPWPHGFFKDGSTNALSKSQRNKRNEGIIQTDENELCTESKVIVLVSRIVSDKTSMVGKVYRGLLKAYDARSDERDLQESREHLNLAYHNFNQVCNTDNEAHHDNNTNNIILENDKIDKSDLPTSNETIQENDQLHKTINKHRRMDAHAVIHYTIAALFEVRPKLKSSPKLSELAQTLVEDLVLGKLYDSLMEEIRLETYEKDNFLSAQIDSFLSTQITQANEDTTHKYLTTQLPNEIAAEALNTITQLTHVRSPSTKLKICVDFVEQISLIYTEKCRNKQDTDSDSQTIHLMSTDSLLTLVCQYIIYAQVPFLNAEISFIEEFVRDDQLLKGKQGYVLVTLQASLSFLNGSSCQLPDYAQLFL